MNLLETLTDIARAHYGADLRFGGVLSAADAARAVFRLDGPEGPYAAVRAARADAPPPDWAAGTGARDSAELLETRAALLEDLARLDLPAPRLLRARAGAALGAGAGWLLLATAWVPGERAAPTLGQIEQMGAALGRMHARTLGGPPGAGSWWDLGYVLPAARAQLRAPAEVPGRWARLREECLAALAAVERRRAGLPQALIHADVWARNAIGGPDGLTLIDWDCAGRGCAVLDLARLLLECHLDAAVRNNGLIAPDPQRIAAALAGYLRWRRPAAAELAALEDAMRFGAAANTAFLFAQAASEGWTAPLAQVLERRENRMAASAPVAQIALRHL
jgi:Ser/Thr protein kinase RdoA (MazF antagonist)